MDRKAIAQETLEIMRQGSYVLPDETRIDIRKDLEESVRKSILITPKEGERILRHCEDHMPERGGLTPEHTVTENLSTVDAVRRLAMQGRRQIGVLNFASAKNPGGGFLNGAMAQEESLAASGTLYKTLVAHEEYYRENRAYRSMIYTDYGIYSPDVVFFRDGAFRLAEPVKASVLTLPAVNMGQVIQKGEDTEKAKAAMKRRMRLALAIFAEQEAKHLILGAYGCGVFRNDPKDIAAWWRELLDEGFGHYFDSVFYAVLDRSKDQNCIRAFSNL